MSQAHGRPAFVPALGKHALTRFYDSAMALTLNEQALRRRLVTQLALSPGQRVLDLGCGTASLSILIKQHEPSAEVVGLDLDPQMLELAKKKAARAGVLLTLVRGSASEPPFSPGSFERVATMLVLHHLTTDDKRRALAACRTLLSEGGELHIADWGKPRTRWASLAFRLVRRFDGAAVTEANFRGQLPELIRQAGFREVVETGYESTVYGTLVYLRARA